MFVKTENFNVANSIKYKLSQYKVLSKLGLSSFVIFSSIVGFLYGSQGMSINWVKLLFLALGGTLVTFASNAINQFIEKDSDKLMTRTKDRPLPTGALSQLEVILFIGLCAVAGILTLTFAVNATTGVLSILSLFIYGFIYTPMKKISSLAVFVGAIPGAMPPLMGYVAATGALDQMALWLFLMQFFWQFPHFWAIAWLSFDDYKKADIMLLPTASGKTGQSTWVTFIYTLVLIPLSFYPILVNHKLTIGNIILILLSIGFTYLAFNFHRNKDDKSARTLMFGSFAYLIIFLISIFL